MTKGPAWAEAFLEMMAVERAAAKNTLAAYGRDLADAAGFLAGLARGLPVATCLRMGAIAAAEVIGHYGARPEADLQALVYNAHLEVVHAARRAGLSRLELGQAVDRLDLQDRGIGHRLGQTADNRRFADAAGFLTDEEDTGHGLNPS